MSFLRKVTIEEKIERTLSYLEIKVQEKDWRSVADAANDLRLLTCAKNITKYKSIDDMATEEKVCL